MSRNTVLICALGLACLWSSAAKAADAALANQWVTYGLQLYGQQQYDGAEKAFSTAVRADPSNSGAWKGLGNVLFMKKDYAGALKYYRYALQLNPSDTQLAGFVQQLSAMAQNSAPAPAASATDLVQQAHSAYAAGQYDTAIQTYQAAIAADPNNAKAYQGMGNCYYAKSDKSAAVAAYQKALQIDPNNTPLKAFLARYAPEAAQASGIQVANGPRDWPQPLWRSAILPGWGQMYNGDTAKGWIIGTLTWGSLIGTVATYIVGDNARTTYNGLPYGSSPSQFNNSYNTWNTMATVNNVLAITFLASYTFNLVDAIVSAKPITTAVGLAPNPDSPVQMGMLDNGTLGAKMNLARF